MSAGIGGGRGSYTHSLCAGIGGGGAHTPTHSAWMNYYNVNIVLVLPGYLE